MNQARYASSGAGPSSRHARSMLPILLLLAGCATSNSGKIATNAQDFGRPDAPMAMAESAVLRVGPLDTISVSVFEVPTLSGDFSVDARGNIVMPLIGEVPASGKTPDELALDLEQRLGSRYLKSPDVQVALKSSVSQRVTVDGAVTAPGIYPVAGSQTLLQSVAMAKGTTVDANPSKVVVFRTIEGKRTAAGFNLKEIRNGAQQDPAIYGNDVIVVDGSNVKSLWKDMLRTLPLVGLFMRF